MKKDVLHFFLISMSFILLAFFLQTTIVVSPDVSYLMHAAKELIQGGRYGAQIFETNPPMILYLYLAPHFLKELTATDIIFALRLYIFCLSFCSFFLCFYLLKKAVPEDRFYQNILSITLLWVLFLLPVYAFGQREHLFVILTFPYMFLRMLNNQTLSRSLRFLIGLFASAGFALKPFFIIPFVFLELYGLYQKRSIRTLFRIESCTIVGVILFYLVSIVLFQPEYIQIMMPFVFKYYFPFLVKSFSEIFLSSDVIFCFAVLSTYVVFYSNDAKKTVGATLWLMTFGMMLAYFIPRQNWYYHLYPALALSYLLSMHCLTQICFGKEPSRKIISIFILSGFIFFVPIYNYVILLRSAQALKKDLPVLPIEAYINKHSGERSIFCFSLFTSDCFPLVYHTKTRYAERFSSFWWYKGILELDKATNPSYLQDKKFLLESIAEDLNLLKARWVIVNDYNFHTLGYETFNVIDYFSQNEKFRAAWQSYHFQKKIGRYEIYERES